MIERLTDAEWEEIQRGLSCAAIDKPGSNAYRFRGDARAARATEKRLREALVSALVPLEGLRASVLWELAPAVKTTVGDACDKGRAALLGREP